MLAYIIFVVSNVSVVPSSCLFTCIHHIITCRHYHSVAHKTGHSRLSQCVTHTSRPLKIRVNLLCLFLGLCMCQRHETLGIYSARIGLSGSVCYTLLWRILLSQLVSTVGIGVSTSPTYFSMCTNTYLSIRAEYP